MGKVAELFEKLAEIKNAIQAELTKKYNTWSELQEMIRKLQEHDGVSYRLKEYDDAEAWCRFDALETVPDAERDYLDTYLSDYGICVDWPTAVLTVYLGPDVILINDSADRAGDRGVYQSGKQIIPESDYVDDDGKVDVERRNALIEAHMERTGYYPDVFQCSWDDALYPVSTLPKGDKND